MASVKSSKSVKSVKSTHSTQLIQFQHQLHQTLCASKKILTCDYAGLHAVFKALKEAKSSVREGEGRTMARNPLPDGTDCFEIKDAEGNVIELHTVVKRLV